MYGEFRLLSGVAVGPESSQIAMVGGTLYADAGSLSTGMRCWLDAHNIPVTVETQNENAKWWHEHPDEAPETLPELLLRCEVLGTVRVIQFKAGILPACLTNLFN